jgi:hypothetical protein
MYASPAHRSDDAFTSGRRGLDRFAVLHDDNESHAVTSADSPLLANWIGFTIGTGGVSIESDIRRMTALLKAEITASSIVRRLPVVTPGLLIRLLFHITTRCRLRRVISCVALLR